MRLPPLVKRFFPKTRQAGASAVRGMGALASRLYVYLSGFLAVFLMAAHVSPERFGEYSLYQSVLECALMVGTLGSAILFSRHASQVPAQVLRGDVVRTLLLGLPLASLLVCGLLLVQRLPLTTAPFVLILLTLALLSFNILLLAYRRGLGSAGLLNLESGIRSTILVAGIAGFILLAAELTVAYLLLVNLLAVTVVGAAISFGTRSLAPPPGRAVLDLRSQAHALLYSVLMFMLRKSDLLIVASFMPLSYVGAFKLAFLLAEAPSQFVQAYLYTKTSEMLDGGAGKGTRSALLLAKRSFMLGCALFVGLGVFLAVAAPLLHFTAQAQILLAYLAPYFLVRTYTVAHEMVLQLHTPVGSLGRWAFAEVLIKLALYAAIAVIDPARPHYVFLFACVSEFLIYEIRMRALWGFSPFARLIGLTRFVDR